MVVHCDGPEEADGDGVAELPGVIVTVTVLAGAAAVPAEPQPADRKATEVRPHTASIRRPVIADAFMVNIPFI